jgi:hypothetical protein
MRQDVGRGNPGDVLSEVEVGRGLRRSVDLQMINIHNKKALKGADLT